MVYKYKNVERLDPEKGVNTLFENVSCQGRTQKKNFREGHQNFDIFQMFFFSGKISFKQIQEQKRL